MRKMQLMTAAVLCTLALAGCGGSQPETTTPAAAAKTTAAPSEAGADGAKADEIKAETKAGETAADGADEASENSAGSGESAQLTFTWWGNQVRNEVTQEVINLYQAANPGIEVEAQFAPWGDYWQKLATQSAGKTLPDLIQMDYGYLEQYVQSDLLLDLTPYIDDGTIDLGNVDDGIVQAGTVNGKVYAISMGTNAPALFYNKTILDEAGITVKDNMTVDEFIELCRKVYEKTGYKTHYSGFGTTTGIDYAARVHGEQLYGDQKLGLSSPAVIEEYLRVNEAGLAEGWLIDPGVLASNTEGAVEQMPLVYGSSPATMSWCAYSYFSNQLAAFQKAAPEGTEIGMTTWPSAEPAKSNYLKASMYLSVAANSANPKAAAAVVNYFTNDVDANIALKAERGVPISKEVAAAVAPTLDENMQKIFTYINDVVTPNSSPISPPDSPKAAQFDDLVKTYGEQMYYGKITAKEAAQKIFDEGNKLMAE